MNYDFDNAFQNMLMYPNDRPHFKDIDRLNPTFVKKTIHDVKHMVIKEKERAKLTHNRCLFTHFEPNITFSARPDHIAVYPDTTYIFEIQISTEKHWRQMLDRAAIEVLFYKWIYSLNYPDENVLCYALIYKRDVEKLWIEPIFGDFDHRYMLTACEEFMKFCKEKADDLD